MGFYTYSKNSVSGTSMRDELIPWLNEHGVTCTLSGTSTIDITDFNGMSGAFAFNGLTQTSSYNYAITLVTTPGRELIAVHTKNRSSYTNTSNVFISALILNYGGTLYSSSSWGQFNSIPNAKMIQIGSSALYIEFDSTADNYIVPLMLYDAGVKVFDNYFISLNAVEVAPGVIVSDGTKQLISCGLFLFVEYDPATMSE